MANRHFGRIGDVWKHLPLADILLLERPRRYWETHAGSASYPLTPSMERDYGVYHFWEHSRASPHLAVCRYRQTLAHSAFRCDRPSLYPGSSLIAMEILGQATVYLLPDLDGDSVTSLDQAAADRQLPDVAYPQADGVTEIRRAADNVATADVRATFVLVDPFYPFGDTTGSVTPVDLFCQVAARGFMAMFWYGFDSIAHRVELHARIAEILMEYGICGATSPLWCGEVALAALGRPGFAVQPGTRGCGILLANLALATSQRCADLGEALAAIYSTARFPDGEDGSLHFSTVTYW
ncbi:23S rRNA (adenine(2030)-N(6))-methyltransferase RlmJ [Frankia sp. CiP3]|uniref:23S rRNA (adenine(2030)-N(6))-methyltransferase RlmJ n=1 Tax=Frankia sp. CiP3 TaxID=2880971 RepID=UPI001EF60FD9|nr:23S rRNA (adenine(2030)-N(6))-methyltransferase RlmJ [Frankia sp. CiP3]